MSDWLKRPRLCPFRTSGVDPAAGADEAREMDSTPHSAAYLDSHRNFWWNQDFIELMARRLELSRVRTVLDVGCGLGHWGRALSGVLAANVVITGVDQEQAWVEQASAAVFPGSTRFNYVPGRVEALPFPDDSFDLVTCQTVLLHVANVEAALREMRRTLKPDGILLVVEPNNTALVFDTLSMEEPVAALVQRVAFNLICERGRRNLGLGFSSWGDVAPGFFQRAGLREIRVYQSDKTQSLVPPYEGEEQQATLRQLREWAEPELNAWYREDYRKCFIAGGGVEAAFAAHWADYEANQRAILQAISAGSYATSGGTLFYLVSGRK